MTQDDSTENTQTDETNQPQTPPEPTTPPSPPSPEQVETKPEEVGTTEAEPSPPTPSPETQPAPSAGLEYEPKIIGFLCNWCCYAGADLCGVSRYQYPPYIRNVRVMCSTRIDPYIIISVFKGGADGIFIGGCHPGDCHYISGNYHTKNKIELTKRLLHEAGFDENRLRLEWVSASEGERFSKVITEFTEQISKLGPNPIKSGDQKLIANLESAKQAALEFRLRALVGKEYKITTEGNVYGDVKTEEEWDDMFDLAIKNEFTRKQILNLTGKQPYSVIDLAKELDQPSDKILEHIVYLRKNNLVAMDSIDGTTPKYVSLLVEGK